MPSSLCFRLCSMSLPWFVHAILSFSVLHALLHHHTVSDSSSPFSHGYTVTFPWVLWTFLIPTWPLPPPHPLPCVRSYSLCSLRCCVILTCSWWLLRYHCPLPPHTYSPRDHYYVLCLLPALPLLPPSLPLPPTTFPSCLTCPFTPPRLLTITVVARSPCCGLPAHGSPPLLQ